MADESLKKVWKCEPDSDPNSPWKWALYQGTEWEVVVNQCPMGLVTRRSRRLIELFWHYLEGRFPTTRRGAGLYDQAHVYLRAMRLIGHYLEVAKRKKGTGKQGDGKRKCSSRTPPSE